MAAARLPVENKTPTRPTGPSPDRFQSLPGGIRVQKLKPRHVESVGKAIAEGVCKFAPPETFAAASMSCTEIEESPSPTDRVQINPDHDVERETVTDSCAAQHQQRDAFLKRQCLEKLIERVPSCSPPEPRTARDSREGRQKQQPQPNELSQYRPIS